MRLSRLGAIAMSLLLQPIASGQVAPGTPVASTGAEANSAPPSAVVTAAPTPSAIVDTERITVIGTYVPGVEEAAANPVLTINRELIEKSGERTAAELIKNLPIANANGVPISNNATGFTPGASSVSLRGLQPSATLVLIDGRRVAPYPIGANGTDSFIDLNSIPNAAIESIDVLKDGASVLYGADAVAGVINIKFRHNYRGAEAALEYGNTLDKDSGEESASLLFGAGDEKTQVAGVINYYHRNAIANRDRGFSAVPPFLSTNASPYNLELSRDAVVAAIRNDSTITPEEQADKIAKLPADLETGDPRESFFGHAPFGTSGTAPASQYTYTARRSVRFNFNQYSLSFPETERYGGFFNAEHKLFGERLIAYADMFYQNVQTHNELAPSATGDFLAPGSTTLVIPPQNPADAIDPATGQPYGTVDGRGADKFGAPPGAFNPFNPFQQFISGGTRARLAEFGNRLINNETNAFMTTIGLRGDKLFDGNWGYDGGFRYSQIKNTSTGTFVSGVLFDRILNANDPIFDPSSPQFIGTTIPFNPFTDYRVPFPSNQATVNFATVHPIDIDTSELGTLDANIYTTALFQLPAGGVGLAFGGQFRRETLAQNIDELNRGDVVGSSFTNDTNAGRKSYALYAETNIPIFSPANSVPGFYALELVAAGRFESFQNNNTNAAVPKLGVKWQPLAESLTLRSTWGEGFLQPSLYQLYGSSSSFFDTNLNDLPVTVNSNPDVQPEDSRNFNAGVIYTPKFLPGLTFSFDIYNIESTGVVYLPSPAAVLDRDEKGTLLPGEMVLRNPATGEPTRIIETYQNGGSQRARGVDLSLQYQWATRFGTFTSLTQATYLDSFRLARIPGAPAHEVSGNTTDVFDSSDAYLRWKGISRLDWTWKGLDIVATARYFDGFHEFTSGGRNHRVSQTWLFDAQATYDFTFVRLVEAQPVAGFSKGTASENKATPEGTQTANYSVANWKKVLNDTSITIGCNNVFGQDPPKAYGLGGNASGYPGFIYDATGRFVYIRLAKTF
ncbi:MAG: TonB-dependent receptor plug domain-containing protein [Chthoniobacterales bacterium]